MRSSPFTILMVLFLAAGCHPAAAPPELRHIRIAAGVPGGGSQSFGNALVQAYQKALPSMVFEVNARAGVINNLEALQRGDADVGFAFADVAYMAFAGELSTTHERFERLRGIAVLQLNPIHFVVRAGSGIKGVPDLRGKRVGIGPSGGGISAVASNLLLSAFTLGPDTVRYRNDRSRRNEQTNARRDPGCVFFYWQRARAIDQRVVGTVGGTASIDGIDD